MKKSKSLSKKKVGHSGGFLKITKKALEIF